MGQTALPSPPLPSTPQAIPASDPSSRGTFGALRAYPVFRRLWAGSLAASLGQWMQSTGLGWLALELTDSASFVGSVAFAAGLPFLLVSIPGGLIIDRFNRRRVLMVCQVLAALLAILVTFDVHGGFVEPWHLPIFAFLNGSLQAMMNPTQQAIVPSLVPRECLTNSIALMGAGQNLTRVVGPTIAGAAIGLAGTGSAFLMQAIALSVALALVFTIPFPSSGVRRTTASWTSLLDGVRLVAGRPDLRCLFLLISIPTFFVFPYLSFLPVFARDVLEIGPEGLGVLMASSGAGAVAGSLFVASRRSAATGVFLVIQTVAYGVAIFGFAVSSTLPVSVAMLVLAGFLGSSFFSANTALLQHRISDEVRGRIMGAYMLTWGLMPIGAVLMGMASTIVGISAAIAAGAVISNLMTLLLFFRFPALRDL